MPGETTHSKITYAIPTDKVKLFPTEVSKVGAETIDTILFEKILGFESHAASWNLKNGEFGEATTNGITATLPAAPLVNRIMGVYCGSGIAGCKITTSGGALIYGDFVAGSATISLATNQHVWLQSNAPHWLIIAGEPKREQTYGGEVNIKEEEKVKPSASRMAQVLLSAKFTAGGGKTNSIIVKVGGINLTSLNGGSPEGEGIARITFMVLPGQEWEWVKTVGTSKAAETVIVNTLLL